MKLSLDISELLSVQANRPPFLLMDEAFDIEPHVSAASSFYFDDSWFLFTSHFPSEPIVPATIMLEMMMQTGALITLCQPERLANIENRQNDLVYLSSVLRATFRSKIVPGEAIICNAELIWSKGRFMKIKAILERLNKQVVADASLIGVCNWES